MAARDSDFPDDATRVTFASWFTSYSGFVAEICHLFGPRDPVNDAMH
jgi:hypothetical protein